jgi:SAM-dependent methyltransferase
MSNSSTEIDSNDHDDAIQQEQQHHESVLGTLKHWEHTYKEEIAGFAACGIEASHVWYGDDAQEEGVELALQICSSPSQEIVLDSGCGNGLQIVELYNAGFVNITGSDYSPLSIDLASKVIAQAYPTSSSSSSSSSTSSSSAASSKYSPLKMPRLVVDNALDCSSFADGEFTLINDKGTMDAISLHTTEGEANVLLYLEAIARITKVGGALILTSVCNTREELIKRVCESGCFAVKAELEKKDEKKKAVFSFGGQVGEKHVQIAFERI